MGLYLQYNWNLPTSTFNMSSKYKMIEEFTDEFYEFFKTKFKKIRTDIYILIPPSIDIYHL
jgi:hypothetical protein